MKKKAIITVTAFVILIAVLSILRLFPSYASTIKSNWDISLPIKAVLTETYEKDSGASFHGDGVRYHVFSYKYEDYIDLMFAWTPTNIKLISIRQPVRQQKLGLMKLMFLQKKDLIMKNVVLGVNLKMTTVKSYFCGITN